MPGSDQMGIFLVSQKCRFVRIVFSILLMMMILINIVVFLLPKNAGPSVLLEYYS